MLQLIPHARLTSLNRLPTPHMDLLSVCQLLPAVCDPVMGDSGRLYVPGDLPAAYRETIVPLASVLTPNQFEAEQLVGFPLSSESEALRACAALMDRGPHSVGRVLISM